MQVPAAAASGEVLVELVTTTLPGPLPAGTPIASSPFRVEVTYSATGLQPLILPTLLDVVVAAPAAELGGTPVTGLVAYQLELDGSWRLLPSWVDRGRSELHIVVAGNATVAGDAVHVWDAATQSYRSAFPLAPSFSTLSVVQPRDTLWLHVRSGQAVEWAQYGAALPALTMTLRPGWMLLPWVGTEMPFTTGAAELFGVAPAVFRWNAAADAYDVFFSAGAHGGEHPDDAAASGRAVGGGGGGGRGDVDSEPGLDPVTP